MTSIEVGPFTLANKQVGRPTAFKITASSLLQFPNEVVVIGTADGQVLLPQVKDRREDSVVAVLKAKRPVTSLVKAGSTGLFFAVCGGELFLLDVRTLTRRQPVAHSRGIVDVCTLERDRGQLVVAILSTFSGVSSSAASPGGEAGHARREPDDATISIYHLLPTGAMEKQKDISLKSAIGIPIHLAWCNYGTLCVGGSKSAVLVDVAKSSTKNVPIVVDEKRGPCILKLSIDKILLSCAGGIGVVIDMNGFPCPNVGTIVWTAPPVSLALCGPYVLSLTDDGCLEIALVDSPGSIIQTLLINGASGAMAISDESTIRNKLQFSVVIGLSNQHSDVPFRKCESLGVRDQIKAIIMKDEGECSRALEFVREMYRENLPERQLLEGYVYLQGASILLLAKKDWDRAFALLSVGGIDAQKLLALCGYVMDSDESLEDSSIDQEGFEVVRETIQGAANMFQDVDFRKQVQEYVMRSRESPSSTRLDNALMFLLTDIGTSEALEAFCKDPTNRCDLELCIPRLDALGYLLASSLLLATRSGAISRPVVDRFVAMDRPDLLTDIIMQSDLTKTPEDVRFIASSHLDWLLSRAVSVETGNSLMDRFASVVDDFSSLELSKTLKTKYQFLTRALLSKREIYGQNVDVTVLATTLVKALEESLDQSMSRKDIQATSGSLEKLVKESSEAAVTALEVLNASKFRSRLGRECASCLGSLGRHTEALNIFISELNDYEGAERYCEEYQTFGNLKANGPDSAGTKIDPFTALLAIHMERISLDSASPNSTRTEAALKFLARHASRVNPVEALQILPEAIPLTAAMKFLEQAVFRTSHDRRTLRVEKNLSRAENFGTKLRLINAQRQNVVVTDQATCSVCHQSFGQTKDILDVLVQPGTMSLAHLQCPAPLLTRSGSGRSPFIQPDFDHNTDEANWKHLA